MQARGQASLVMRRIEGALGSVARTALVALAVLLADQASKAVVRASVASGARRSLLGDWLRISHVENPGIAFGLLRQRPDLAALASGLATLTLLGCALRARPPLRTLSAGLVLGGWAGNALDRRRHGRVTDFLDLGRGSLRWPAFNLADAAITSGAALLARALSSE